MTARLLVRALCLTVLATASRADGVRIVDAPGVVYFEIQDAVAAAAEGDVLVVAAGTYVPFTIDGVSLTIVAMPGAAVDVTGTVTVRNVGAQQVVQLIGIDARGGNGTAGATSGSPGISLAQNAGLVLVRDGVFVGGHGFDDPTLGHNGGDGLSAVGCERLVLVDCTLKGGAGSWGFRSGFGYGGTGGYGARVMNGQASVHASTITGGEGGWGLSHGGGGGYGYFAHTSALLASGSTFQGGKGGDADDCSYGWVSGNGGHGLQTYTPSPAELLDCTLAGGAPGLPDPCGTASTPGSPGQPLVGPANTLPGSARPLDIPALASGPSSVPFTLTGTPGDQVALLLSARFRFLFAPSLAGTWIVPAPFFSGAVPAGVVTGLGVLGGSLALPDLRTGRAAHALALQALMTAGNAAFLSDPACFVVLDRDAAPDCNANGVNDFLDVAEGTSQDVNANTIPDECEYGGPIWYVDPAAPPFGTGSLGAPFQTIRRAMQNAVDGDSLVLMDGVYLGPENRGNDFAGRNLVVKSFAGSAANCIIDGEGLDYAFNLGPGVLTGRIEALTFRNCQGYRGGALQLSSSNATVVDCVFTGNHASLDGGAIHVGGGAPVITRCTFTGNSAGPGGGNNNGGGGLFLWSSRARVTACTFTGNSNRGMIVKPPRGGDGDVVSHCVFDGNVGGGSAGGLFVFGSSGSATTYVLNSLFTGNTGLRGGGIAVDLATTVVSGCTLAGNSAGWWGGGLYIAGSYAPGVTLEDSILWGNTAGSGDQIHLQSSSAQLAVDACDVQGGPAAVFVAAGATLAWGPNNLDADPLFVSATDRRLQLGSPCIDAGDNAAIRPDKGDIDGDGDFSEPLPLDLDLAPRRIDVPQVPDTGLGAAPVVDMGAYELPVPYAGPIWHVDPTAPPGGVGSLASPFDTIAQAMAAASSGQMVKLLPGTYSGPANRDLDFGSKELVVKSAHGPLATAIDCEGLGRAFRVAGGQTSASMIFGIAIRNGAATNGGAIHVSGASPLIADCIFLDCAATVSGGAVFATASALRLEDCTFLSNSAAPGSNNAGGGAVMLGNSDTRVLRCTFDGNDATGSGGGLLVLGGTSAVSHSVFKNNTAFRGGGAQLRDAGPVDVVDCLFVGNAASRGGGLGTQNAWGGAALCTFTGNAASEGGALYAWSAAAAEWQLSNSILWASSAPTGPQIAFNENLRVDSCDVQGGQAAAVIGSLRTGGTLTWGASNLNVDPLFAGPTDHRLSPGSPCIDAGDNTLVPPDLTDIDGDGDVLEPVPLDLDLLARFFDVPAAPNTGNGSPPHVDLGAYEVRTP